MKKIEIFADGKHVCSTNRSETCKMAIMKFAFWLASNKGFVFVAGKGKTYIPANAKITARFAKQ